MRRVISVVLISMVIIATAGCAVNLYSRRPSDISKIQELEALRQADVQKMEELKAELARKLKGEIAADDVKLELAKRGLVITFIDKIFFDSGKADIKSEGTDILRKVLGILKREARDRNIGIEGHTDNVPITYSGWKSNWELSTARATSVLHYLIERGNVNPERLSAIGHGKHKPVASNRDEEGRRQNRRVEIVVYPKEFKKVGVGKEATYEVK